jgi:hypothetical protein
MYLNILSLHYVLRLNILLILEMIEFIDIWYCIIYYNFEWVDYWEVKKIIINRLKKIKVFKD